MKLCAFRVGIRAIYIYRAIDKLFRQHKKQVASSCRIDLEMTRGSGFRVGGDGL